MLNERKLKILEAIVRGYVSTAEPVGSRTIEKKHNIGISSATIRNEMSDLEEMGLILKPHTSAGSIPSEKGYRIFVDEILPKASVSDSEIELFHQIINKNIEHIDYLMKETAKMIADMTKGIAVISEPKANQVKIRSISFVPIDEQSFSIVIVTDDKKVANKIVHYSEMILLNNQAYYNLGLIMTEELEGLAVSDITNDHYNYLKQRALIDESLLAKILTTMLEILNERNNYKVYTYGKENILSIPEFGEPSKAIEIFKTLEEKQMLVSILGENNENIQVLIGSENQIEQMRDCSIVRKSYSIGDNSSGCIGVIGPTRMEYEKAINALNYVVDCFKNMDLFD